ncbi:bifunctional 2',3'-cyclic-nucleotide 2'-phosphodiesterase/3'-nucleotidase [Paenibacillus sp. JX-17]|uniref:Bifunctional 2',3'-cyclic-nucleotide 2'-phosphodiesterase/3'-nucleotidase n=1 Tax=Paenibacillus lacisoli TaxID=3064525 RepID=A0ABT9CH19_9BACL|nr:bifunctional 2',3'-cyclic-nucleotide 2'-phosphodiesterase/3'-nucleotidase [Paenibacillus sp. JX-17]MDO7908200.1 bifunctional 2',3'-cyclic-nucleotide 2'-phosphodiesterase/3'-nucleotidase [Paenibacillus sp. JX-17]
MKQGFRNKVSKVVASSLTIGLLSVPLSGVFVSAAPATSTVKLRVMETTDVHTNLMSYDYYKSADAPTVGLARTATLVKEARKENANTFLIDNGDLIQGTPLGTYEALVDPVKAGEVHAVYKAMNLMGYDIATFGNHEFNYGLDFLNVAIKGANFPYVNANVYNDDKDNNPDNDVNTFTPYKIISKTFKDESGQEQTVKIGVLGLVTPQITEWDKANLEGKVITKDIVATAEKFIPKMRAEGADIIIASAHTGFNGSAQANVLAEDAIYPLSKVKGIDAITFSHTHKVFPAKDDKSLDALFKDASGNLLPGVDNAKGTINGVPAVQAGYGGSNLGLIDLTLEKQDGKWTVASSQSSTKAIYDTAAKKSLAEPDQAIVDAVKAEHEATIKYTNSPIGTTTAPIYSYFALVKDDPSVQIVTNAQKEYVEDYVKKNLPQYAKTPVLSVGAPFKAGRNGPEEYTDIAKGSLAIKSAGDLYLYDNTLKAILVKGSVIKEWLEMSAGKFNQIDPNKTEEQPLLNDSFAVYNFDVIDGVTYQVDVTKPAKYTPDGKVNDANSNRIVNLQFQGKPIDPNQEFIVATNNYRASGGGNFPGVKGSKYIIDSPDENRQILMDYITKNKEINPTADNNWSIAPISGNVKVTFTSSPKAETYAKNSKDIKYLNKTDDKGFGVFSLDLSKAAAPSVPTTPSTPAPTTGSFKDVPEDHWAFSYISDLAAKKLVSGKTADAFAPNANVTRAEFASLLVNALELKAKGKAPFKDVAASSWYSSAVAAAYENGLISGVTKNSFAPNQPVTREQMAVIAKHALDVKAGETIKASSTNSFADASKISAWAQSDLNVAVDRGVIGGRGANLFVPKATATRAEAAKVVATLLSNIEVQLLSINDFHGQLDYKKEVKDASGKVTSTLGGVEYLAAYLKQREAANPNTLLVHAGDAVGASAPVSALMQDEPTIDILNRLGFDVGTVGNHEFDKGPQEALRLINGGVNPKTGKDFGGADFPYVVANVLLDGKPFLDPYVIKEVGGAKIGFIGVITNITPTIVSPAGVKGLTFTDQAAAVNKAVAELKAKGVKSIVILAHDPFSGSTTAPTGEVVDLANHVDPEVDVILSGHDHGRLNTIVNGKLIVESNSYGTAFSDMTLTIDRATQNIIEKKADVVDVKQEGITPDPEIKKMLENYQQQNAPVLNAPVGKTDAAITRTTTPAGESALGNLIADGMRETMKSDFAFMNSGGIRNDLPQGTVTYGNMFSINPFGNVLIKLTLTGAQMKELLEQQWTATGTKIGQVSGFTYSYDDSKPVGSRIVEIKKADGTKLDDKASYTIVVNDFMSTGGDGYTALTKGTNREAGPVDLDAFISYVKTKFASSSITAKTEDRITKVNK